MKTGLPSTTEVETENSENYVHHFEDPYKYFMIIWVRPCIPNFKPNIQVGCFLTQKQEIISKVISELFLRNFCEFKKTGYFQKNSKLRKLNYSETHENEKCRKFCLMQGLTSGSKK